MTGVVDGSSETGLLVRAGDTLHVALGPSAGGSTLAGVAFEALGLGESGAASSGMLIAGVSRDTARVRVAPRAGFAETAVESSADTLRLMFTSDHRVRAVRAVDRPASQAAIDTLSAQVATHSRLGDVVGGLAASDTLRVALAAGDTLELTFDPGPIETGATRHYVVVAGGRTTVESGGAGPMSSRLAGGAPLRFQLMQNVPNPFRDRTRIEFELPVKADVKLEVYDVAGRRVRTLRTSLPPGRHALDWDRRDGRGHRVAPGIYLYRIHAGSFSDRRRMVLVP